MRYLTATLPVVLCAVSGAMLLKPSVQALPGDGGHGCTSLGTAYARTTLYFGTTHNQGVVSEEDWRVFLRDEVTPRFPNGLTFWTASGQWRRPNGSISQEPAKVLLLVHEESATGRAAVRAIIQRYKTVFRQESVLSETATVCAEF